jgi:hypothetical protein
MLDNEIPYCLSVFYFHDSNLLKNVET